MNNEIFNNLFVLELANNHWGSADRGLEIIKAFATVTHHHHVKASIKLQFRHVDTFIHQNYRDLKGSRYITKTMATRMNEEGVRTLVKEVKGQGLVPMATPFDERSVALCEELSIGIIKIASSDINDWPLIHAIARTNKPVIISTGGASLSDIQACVHYFDERDIPIAINHCVSQYPTAPEHMNLAQIGWLKSLFPDHVIGFSTHEANDRLDESIMMAYAYGARTFERHIDIPNPEKGVSPYCSLPEDVERWIKGYQRAVALAGSYSSERRPIPEKEVVYLDELVRGVYAKKDLPEGKRLTMDDVYFAIPLQKGQLSVREFNETEITTDTISADEPIKINRVQSDYFDSNKIRIIEQRGLL